MNIQINPINDFNPIIKKESIQYTLFSVKKPVNESGCALILETISNEFISKKYNELSNSELKKMKYQTAYFVSSNKQFLDFSLILYSDVMEVLMETTIKSQVCITNPVYVVENNILSISEPLGQLITETINNANILSETDNLDVINTLIRTLPDTMKQIFNEYIQVENCRLINTTITDKGKREHDKVNIHKAMQDGDMYNLVDHKDKVKEMLEMKDILTTQSMNTKNKALTLENESYDLLTERYQKFKDSGLIAPDVSMQAFMKKLSVIDSDFDFVAIEEKADITDNETEEKAYFDEE